MFLLLTAFMLWGLHCQAENAFDGGILLGADSSCSRKDASLLFEIVDTFEDDSSDVTREYKVNDRHNDCGFITNLFISFLSFLLPFLL